MSSALCITIAACCVIVLICEWKWNVSKKWWEYYISAGFLPKAISYPRYKGFSIVALFLLAIIFLLLASER